MSRAPVAVRTAPAPKNSSVLNRLWFRACISAAVIASAAALVMLFALKASARPRPRNTSPRFSIVE